MNRLYTYNEIEKVREFTEKLKTSNSAGCAYFENSINESVILLFDKYTENMAEFGNNNHIYIKDLCNDLLKENLDSVVLASIRFVTTAHNTTNSSYMAQFKISDPSSGVKVAIDVSYKKVDSPLETGEYGVFIDSQIVIEGEIGDTIGWNGNLIDSFSGFKDIGFGYIFDRVDRNDNVFLSNSTKSLLEYDLEGNFVSLTDFAKIVSESTRVSSRQFLEDMKNIFEDREKEVRYKISVVKKTSVNNLDIIIRYTANISTELNKVLSMTIIDNTELHQKASEAKEVFRFFRGGVITWYPILNPDIFRVSKITSFVFDEIVDYDNYTIKYDDLISLTQIGTLSIKDSTIEGELLKLSSGVIEETNFKFEVSRNSDAVVLSVYASVVDRTFEGVPAKVVITFMDMTEEKKLTDEIARTYKIDPLTTIFNRASYYEDCKDVEGTLLCIDIDDFKDINDTHGHEIGDDYLVETAELLKIFADSHNGKAYRIGGDEFVVSIPKVLKEEEQKILCEELIESRINKNKQASTTYDISFTIGSASTCSENITPKILYELSDRALYDAKRIMKGSFSVATDLNAQQYIDQKKIENSINRGIRNEEFFPKYVPRFNIQGNLIGIEIDASWKDSNGNDLASYDFMHHMYRMNVVHKLDAMVLGKALEELKYAISELKLSPRELSITGYASKSTVSSNDLRKIITQNSTINYNLASFLEIDIPEISVSLNSIKIVSEVNKVAKLRVAISLQAMEENDFEDILNYLEIVKPNSLVFNARANNALNYKRSDEVITAIMGIARTLKIDFYVIGVDSEEEEQFFKRQGFVVFQGNHFSKSLTITEIIKIIKEQKNK